jgi:hypothetical protein
MKPILLVIGGIIQILILALHIGMFFGISSSSDMPTNFKISAHIFNAAVTVTVLFFAYVSLLRRKDLISTKLGHIICIFTALFYLQRGLVELFLRGFDAVTLGLCIVITAIYIIAILPPKK